jgi:hypothetical protein
MNMFVTAYCRIVGAVFVLLSIADIASPGLAGVLAELSWVTRILLLVGGGCVLYVGIRGGPPAQILAVRIVTLTALLIAFLGVLAPTVLAPVTLFGGTNFNALFVLVGLTGLAVWFSARNQPA